MDQLRYAFVFFVFISIALPAKSELWGCVEFSIFNESHPHSIELVSTIKDGTGSIKIQGLPIIPTQFGIEGLARAWRWFDYNSSKEGYAFVIRDDYGAYYEFLDDKPTEPVETYSCHKH